MNMNILTYKARRAWMAAAAVLCLLAGCTAEEDVPQLANSLTAEPQVSGTRAEDNNSTLASVDSLNEASLGGGLDVFVFDKSGVLKLNRHISNAKEGEQSVISTGSWMESLQLNAGQTYDVYAIANATSTQLASCTSVASIKALTQEDADIYRLHSQDHAKHFLMSQHTEWKPTDESRQVIKLDALKRAAAKMQYDVTFDVEDYEAGTPHFKLENYNISTSLLEKDSEGQVSVTEMTGYVGNSNSFKGEDGLFWNRYLAYSYAFSWAGDLEHRPSVLMEVPMTYTGEGEDHGKIRNYYYRIPLRPVDETSLERNTLYRVKAKINSLGASTEVKSDMVTDVQYSVLPWADDSMDVNVPDRKFLMVTPSEVYMRNVRDDNSVKFIASGPCKVDIQDVYYYDKSNTQVHIGSRDKFYPTLTLSGSNSGNLKIVSKIPENFVVKYIKARISLTDDTNTYKDVLIKQYPLEYAQNIPGWYSTRSTAGWVDWVTDQEWHRSKKTYSDYSGSYRAKVYKDKDILYMVDGEWGRGYVAETYGSSGNTNNNMYVIQITSTNGKYVIAHPKINTRKKSDKPAEWGSEDHVVSPAFMIASQLGAVQSAGFNSITAIEHCNTYREVGTDGTKYDNWRLPTNEEVQIIVDYQGKSNSPIAEVLSGAQYRTLSQDVVNTGISGANSGKFVRCVRDMSAEEIEKLEKSKK